MSANKSPEKPKKYTSCAVEFQVGKDVSVLAEEMGTSVFRVHSEGMKFILSGFADGSLQMLNGKIVTAK